MFSIVYMSLSRSKIGPAEAQRGPVVVEVAMAREVESRRTIPSANGCWKSSRVTMPRSGSPSVDGARAWSRSLCFRISSPRLTARSSTSGMTGKESQWQGRFGWGGVECRSRESGRSVSGRAWRGSGRRPAGAGIPTVLPQHRDGFVQLQPDSHPVLGTAYGAKRPVEQCFVLLHLGYRCERGRRATGSPSCLRAAASMWALAIVSRSMGMVARSTAASSRKLLLARLPLHDVATRRLAFNPQVKVLI